MTGFLSRSTCCVVLALSLIPFASAQDAKPDVGRLLPGNGVADPAAKIAFFPNTTVGIDAVDLATGKVLWTTKDADRPLIATANRLFAQQGTGNKLQVVALNTSKDGQRIFASSPIPLPDWVAVQAAYGRAFQSSVRMDRDNLYLVWEARAFYSGGARPPREIEAAARKNAAGVARIDRTTGKVEPLDADAIAAGKILAMPGVEANAKVGSLTFQVQDGPAKIANQPFQKRRNLQARNAANEIVWQLDIAAPIFLPPKP